MPLSSIPDLAETMENLSAGKRPRQNATQMPIFRATIIQHRKLAATLE